MIIRSQPSFSTPPHPPPSLPFGHPMDGIHPPPPIKWVPAHLMADTLTNSCEASLVLPSGDFKRYIEMTEHTTKVTITLECKPQGRHDFPHKDLVNLLKPWLDAQFPEFSFTTLPVSTTSSVSTSTTNSSASLFSSSLSVFNNNNRSPRVRSSPQSGRDEDERKQTIADNDKPRTGDEIPVALSSLRVLIRHIDGLAIPDPSTSPLSMVSVSLEIRNTQGASDPKLVKNLTSTTVSSQLSASSGSSASRYRPTQTLLVTPGIQQSLFVLPNRLLQLPALPWRILSFNSSLHDTSESEGAWSFYPDVTIPAYNPRVCYSPLTFIIFSVWNELTPQQRASFRHDKEYNVFEEKRPQSSANVAPFLTQSQQFSSSSSLVGPPAKKDKVYTFNEIKDQIIKTKYSSGDFTLMADDVLQATTDFTGRLVLTLTLSVGLRLELPTAFDLHI